MKFVIQRRLVLAAFLTIAVVAAAAVVKPVKVTPKSNFQRTKERINTLLTPRLKPEPLPDVLPNPFQLAEVAVVKNPEQKTPEKIQVSSDDESLLYYSASLKVSGVVRINDQVHLVINQAPYKVGDTLNIKTKDGPVKLRVLGISPGELTLGLNDAVQIVKFKK